MKGRLQKKVEALLISLPVYKVRNWGSLALQINPSTTNSSSMRRSRGLTAPKDIILGGLEERNGRIYHSTNYRQR